MIKALSMQLMMVALLSAQFAFASDCYYGGRYWPPGTRLGPLTCQNYGTWH